MTLYRSRHSKRHKTIKTGKAMSNTLEIARLRRSRTLPSANVCSTSALMLISIMIYSTQHLYTLATSFYALD
jgi:hypothetical protein